MEPDPRDPMNQCSLQSLRESCDKYCDEYCDGRDCPCHGWVTLTEFADDEMEDLRNAAKQKNFDLEKVWKLNFVDLYFFMTFTAKNAETDECLVFRGVVHALSHKVYLCEVKETGDIGIPSDHVEHHSPHTWYNASTKSYFDMIHALSVGLVHYL
ncbi:uncharacterized protein LOC142536923 isoform X3 [Primulina tabacum]|uniref:uncharacterized protein LOC142536923 isoform X3 n=1 Tax=Primulina tabacum TaxID=48773 RepID=UPI003F5A4A9D